LFPWVPEAESLFQWVEAEFERQYWWIDLVVRDLEKSHDWKPAYVGDLAYEWEKASTALTKSDGDDFQHLVEVDTMILGKLIKAGSVQPFTIPDRSFLPFSLNSVSVGGTAYGVPHWACGYFIASSIDEIKGATDLSSLLTIIAERGTNKVDIAGDMDGSWDSVMVYLDAYSDQHPNSALDNAVKHATLDQSVAAALGKIGRACTKDSKNFCGEDASEIFASAESDSLFGYSERLHDVAKAGRDLSKLRIVSAPLGSQDRPVLFTDALVLSPKCQSDKCRQAAAAFARFYTSDWTYETVLLSLDKSGASPRYLLPGTSTAFDHGRVARDPIYQQLQEEINGAIPFPILGVPDARNSGKIRAEVKKAIGLE
jgi:thiamine pyridinylase